jgi:hypothetical protein
MEKEPPHTWPTTSLTPAGNHADHRLAPTSLVGAAWCGLGTSHVEAALRWVLPRGVLRQVGTHWRTALFLPGAAPERRKSGGAR